LVGPIVRVLERNRHMLDREQAVFKKMIAIIDMIGGPVHQKAVNVS